MHWTQFLPSLLKGAEVTAIIAVASTILGAIFAFAAGIARVAGGRLWSAVALAYIELFRGTSLLVQLFWLYYALPLIGISFDPIATGIFGLALNIGAYGAEVVRGALLSVSEQQREAAKALNFNHAHTLIHIVLPQAIIEMMPPFGNLAIQNLKDTALVSFISIADLSFHAQSLRNLTLQSVSIYTLTLLIYFAMALVIAAFMRWLEKKLRRGAAFPKGRHMMYGFAWDTSSSLAFAISILPILGIGLIVTIEATVCGFAIAMVVGLVLALLRRTRSRIVAWPVALIIEFLRDTPLLIQLFFLFYVLPTFGIVLPAFLTGALALGLQYSAYTSEVYRGGLDAVGRGQWEAATALNLSSWLTYRDVVIPQAIPRIVPALGNYLVSMLKDTPVLSVITVVDMLNLANLIGDRTFEYLIPLSLVGLIFLVLTLACSALIHGIERILPKRGIALR